MDYKKEVKQKFLSLYFRRRCMTHVPLPDFKLLLSALLPAYKTREEITKKWHEENEKAILLSRSSWSMALIALLRLQSNPDKELVVWIPDLFCNESLIQLRQIGVRFVFYQVTEKMLPDMQLFKELLADGQPDILFFVHYFGRPTPAAELREFCKKNHTWLVEDAAHVLTPVRGIGIAGDFVLYSPHKHLPIPDGAVLVFRKNGPSKFLDEQINLFSSTENIEQLLFELKKSLRVKKAGYFNRRILIWVLKRIVQKTGVVQSNSGLISFFEIPTMVSKSLIDADISSLSVRLLSKLVFQLNDIALVRQQNQLLWDELINRSTFLNAKVKFPERPSFREWTPYMASYILESGEEENLYKELSRQFFPVSTWPDLPHEVISSKEKHINAWNLRHGLIYLPVHQSIALRRLIRKTKLSNNHVTQNHVIRSEWSEIDHVQWEKNLSISRRSNLLQSWSYGEAKSEVEGWKVKRGVFFCENELIAIIQVLQKRVAGFISVTRINRGPILLKELTDSQKSELIKNIGSFGNIIQLKILFFAPELTLSGFSLFSMFQLGYRKLTYQLWESAWLDLELDLVTLRKKLDSKWRNMLNFSERTNLTLEKNSSDELFEWILEQYGTMMKEKEFKGPPVEFIRALRKKIEQKESLLVFRASSNGNAVAGISIVLHGSSATYLLGVNNVDGRNLKANYFLIWQAIEYLKEKNIMSFDLGGIDRTHTHGIAQFKLGLNADRYENIGEFVKW